MFVEKAPSFAELVAKLGTEASTKVMMNQVSVVEHERYLHWDKLQRLDPPAGLTNEEWWLKVKVSRSSDNRPLPLSDGEGRAFGYTLPDMVLQHLHHIDQRCSGEVAMDEVVTSEQEAGQRFLVNSLMEEAIRSSQLEGATTSRAAAKELLRSGREPKDRSERMIANNYRALQFMRDEMGQTLSPDSVLELHRILTEGTLDNPDAAGRLQRPEDGRVAVYDRDDGKPIHIPPPADQLPERMRLLCDFANGGGERGQFVHPVLRAILLHFWLAYDHPFEDGNGRTARILFFWSMHKQGYWLAEYLPISRRIRKAPAQYARAFMEAETDGGDTTYFLIHQLRIIEAAIDDLHVYLRRKIAEKRDIESLLQDDEGLNGRQLALLTDAVRHPDGSFAFESHARSHRVSHETARTDLRQLEERGLLVRRGKSRRHRFEPAPNLPERLRESDA
ncbi:MAG TPA: Fic family protein [Solirubrobacterales bacterium]|jgi:Fic family protein|nr:Fic family protein [Solirubrobacterales bacterium]